MKLVFKMAALSFLPGFASLTFAAPNITSTSGTLANNQSITISGSQFGTKSPAAPLIWDSFENGTVGNAIQNTSATVGTWGTGSGSTNVFYTNTLGYGGSGKSARHPFTSSYNSSLSKNTTFSTIYMDFKRYYPSANGLPSNYKPYRFYGDSDTMELYPGNGCGYAVNSMIHTGTTSSTDWSVAGLSGKMDGWQHYQLIFKESSANTANGTIISLLNGTRDGYNLSGNAITRNNSTGHLDQARIGHYFDTGARDGCDPSNNSEIYTDNVYLDTTWARVELGNESTYATSKHREIQIPSAWSSSGNSITVSVNTGTFQPGQTAYLYVFDSTGNVNTPGFPVTIGTSGSISAPPAPNLNSIIIK